MHLYYSYKTISDPKGQGKGSRLQRNRYNWLCYKFSQSEADTKE